MTRDLEQAFDELGRAVARQVSPPPVDELVTRARTDTGDRSAGPTGEPAPHARPVVGTTSFRRRRGAFVLGGLAAAAALVGPAVAVLMPTAPDRSEAGPVRSEPAPTDGPSVPSSGSGTAASGPGRSPTPAPRTTAAPTASSQPAPSATGGRTVQVTISVLSRATGASGCSRFVEVTRSVPAEDPVRGAVLATLAGVTAEERARGLWSVWGEAGRPTPADVRVDGRTTSVRVDLRTLRDVDGASAVRCRGEEIREPVNRAIRRFGASWNATFLVRGSVDAQRAYVDRGGPAAP